MTKGVEKKVYPQWQWTVAKITVAICIPFTILFSYLAWNTNPPAPKPAAGSLEYETCSGNVDCASSRAMAAASVDCGSLIERYARYDFKWTNGTLESIFQGARWSERADIISRHGANRIIEFRGDKIKMQNGFGAFRTIRYECDYDPVADEVVDTRIFE